MSGLKDRMGREAFSVGFDYAYSKLEKDIKTGAEDLLGLAEKYLSKTSTAIPIDEIKKAINTPGGVLFSFVERAMQNIDKALLKNLFLNAVYEIAVSGRKRLKENEAKLGITLPKFILMEPTSGWNLPSSVVSSAEEFNLSLDDMSKVVKEGQELGVHLYFFSGGEPLMRKADLLELCRRFPRSNFMCFTNGTLIDEEFCKAIKDVGNFVPIICLDELEEKMIKERGEEAWEKMLNAGNILKEAKILFGTSICYTSANCERAVSTDFIGQEIKMGSIFSMYSAYSPIAIGDNPELMSNPDQRSFVIRRIKEIRDFREGNGLFAFDFQKDAEYLGGSISGGRTYLHVDARGDVRPSSLMAEKAGNIRNMSILEIAKNPNALAYLEPVDRLYSASLLYD